MDPGDVIDSLVASCQKWSSCPLSSLVDSLRVITDDLVQQSHRFDMKQKLLAQKLQSLTADDGAALSKEEHDKLVRMFQTEIELQMKRFADTSAVITRVRESISTLPDVVPLLEQVLRIIDSDPEQAAILDQLRRELDALRFDDSTIEALKNEIRDVELERDQRIQKIQSDSVLLMEVEKSKRIRELSDQIGVAESQKAQVQRASDQLRSEISEGEESMRQLDEADRQSRKTFFQESSEVEHSLMVARGRLDSLKSSDLSSRLAQLRLSFVRLQDELREKEARKGALEAELASVDDWSNEALERELQNVEERLRHAENDLSAAPSLSEWQNAQSELKIRRRIDRSTQKDIASDVARLQQQCTAAQEQVKRGQTEVDQLKKLIESAQTELSRLTQAPATFDGAEFVVDLLKQQKTELQHAISIRETDVANLRRERDALEGRIQSLKDEKAALLDMASSPTSDTAELRKTKMNGAERILLNLVIAVFGNPGAKTIAAAYLVMLHILVLFVLFT
jgi:predicted  nucleic acid-binding Zn-ribbon protein